MGGSCCQNDGHVRHSQRLLWLEARCAVVIQFCALRSTLQPPPPCPCACTCAATHLAQRLFQLLMQLQVALQMICTPTGVKGSVLAMVPAAARHTPHALACTPSMVRTNACSSRTEASGCAIGQVGWCCSSPGRQLFAQVRTSVDMSNWRWLVATVAQLARMARVWDAGAALSEPKVGAQVWHVTRSMHHPHPTAVALCCPPQVHEIRSMGKHENDGEALKLLTEVARQVSLRQAPLDSHATGHANRWKAGWKESSAQPQ